MTILNGNGLFIKYWDTGMPELSQSFYITPIPGKKRGINAAITSGMNIGINRYISNEKLDATRTVLKYLTSEETQKEIVVKRYGLYTGITKLYDDEEVCSILECSFIKKIQSINANIDGITDIDQYGKKVVKLFKKYMYGGDNSPENVLKEIDDITRIHSVALDSSYNIAIFFILVVIIFLIVIVYVFLLYEKVFENDNFFSSDLWLIYCLGYIMIASSEFFQFGELSDMKCQLRYSMLYIGIFLGILPFLYKLIVCFPENNKYSDFLHHKKCLFLILSIGMEVTLNLLFVFSPYSKINIMFEDTEINKNYSKCTMNHLLGTILICVDVMLKIVFILAILFLSFIEWNTQEIYKRIRGLLVNEYIAFFSFSVLIILDNFKINNYYIPFFIHSIIIIIICLGNYAFIYCFKVHQRKVK